MAPTLIRLTLAALLILFLPGCSDNNKSTNNNDVHVWKEQTGALDKAEKVEQLIEDAAIEKRESIEMQTR